MRSLMIYGLSNQVPAFSANRFTFRPTAPVGWIATALLLLVVATAGCDTRQHLANSQTSRVMASPHSAAVVPDGWRKTKFGWEHSSQWGLQAADQPSKSINQWIHETALRNPPWSRQLLSRIRGLSPISIALFQVLAIGVILKISTKVNRAQ
ncbi:hypothetical protein [Planctomycetes bacterium K23_9]